MFFTRDWLMFCGCMCLFKDINCGAMLNIIFRSAYADCNSDVRFW